MKISGFVILILLSLQVFSQIPTSFEKNQQLGRGINLGNMFEPPSETEWGNPFQDEYMQMISELGFNHVRIPIRWETDTRSMSNAPYTIYPEFLERIQHVIDLALKNKLHAIINMHHHEALFENPDTEKERFLSMWNQISKHFEGYSDSLMFEILNEPHGNLTPEKWNQFSADAVNTIRQTSPLRYIVIGTANYGGLGGLTDLQLPDDDHLILTIHYYNPFSFTHQGADWVGSDADAWLGTEWQDTESERKTIQTEFAPLVQYSETNHVPIHIGEFGSYSTADMASRKRWTNYLARYFETLNFSWAYWEFSAGFGIYNPTTETYYPELVDALLINPMAEATPVIRTKIKETSFETDDNREGWNLYNNSGASSQATVKNGLFSVSISNSGTENWHIQLSLNNITLEEGKNYEISFRAKSDVNRALTCYAGMSIDPWSSYSGASSFQLTEEFNDYILSFQMKNNTDTNSRIVFDIGKSVHPFILDHFTLNEVSISTAIQEAKKKDSFFYPNPVSHEIFIPGNQPSKISIYALNGSLMFQKEISSTRRIDLSHLIIGSYIITKTESGNIKSAKLIKTN